MIKETEVVMLEVLDMEGFADCDIDLSDEDLLDELPNPGEEDLYEGSRPLLRTLPR
jgi:hypothetical protein